MAELTFRPVDHDPFAAAGPSNAPQNDGPSISFVPVDHDPFAGPAPAAEPPQGFATRAQREGTERQAKEGEYLADAVRMRQQQDKASPLGRVDAYMRGAAGWVPGMNKLAAAGDAAFGAGKGESFGERYDDNLMRQRALDDADAALNPGSRLAGQVAGFGATAALLPNLSVVKEGARGATTANAALTGGAYGGLNGAIESDGGVADKAMAGGTMAALGAGAGAVAPHLIAGVGKATGSLSDFVARALSPFRAAANPQGEAARRVAAAMARDGVEDPAAALRGMQQTGAPAVAGDVGGEATRGLARSAANTSPEARTVLNDAVSERFAGQGDRVTDMVRGFGPSSAGKTLEELEQAARAANRPAYGRAYMEGGNGLWNDVLERLSQAPAVQDSIRAVTRTGANKTVADGMPPVRNPFTTDDAGNLVLSRRPDGSIATPNLQFWDYVSRELRGKAGEAARAGNKDLAGDFTNLRRMLLGELDTAVPSFKDARTGAAKFFQAEDALEAGQKFVSSRMANEEAKAAVAKMTPQERELFAEGYRSNLIARIREIGDGRDVVKAVFGTPAARERVGIAIGLKESAKLEAAMKIETAMLKLQEAVKGNSSTVRQLTEAGMAGGALGYAQGGDLHSAGVGAVAGMAARRAVRAGSMKINEGLAREVGELLASGDPKSLDKLAKMATRSRPIMSLIESVTDEAGKLAGLGSGSGPLEITVRSRPGAGYMPAAADQNE